MFLFTGTPLYIISGYFRLNVPIERILAKLETILEVLDGAKLIYTMELKMKSNKRIIQKNFEILKEGQNRHHRADSAEGLLIQDDNDYEGIKGRHGGTADNSNILRHRVRTEKR